MKAFDESTRKQILGRADESGFPMQRYCSKTLSELNWNVEEEFPVSISPIPETRVNPIETTGDIHATRLVSKARIHVILECKRKHGVHWNFFGDIKPPASFIFPELAVVYPSAHRYYVTIPRDGWQDAPLSCSVGWEAKNDPSKQAKNDVREGGLQAWTSTLSTLLKEEAELDDILAEGNEPDSNHEVFIPVLVTGAELLQIRLDYNQYKVGKPVGEVEPLNSLVLRLGVPSHLRSKVESPLPPVADMQEITRPDVFVVRYDALPDFVTNLSETISKLEDRMYEPPEFFTQY